MKEHVEISHLTKFDAFRVNRDQVIDLEKWFKIHTNVNLVPRVCHLTAPCLRDPGNEVVQTSLMLRQRPPKPYKLLKFLMISVILLKMGKHT